MKLTREYYARREAISTLLGANPEIVGDLRCALIASNGLRPARVRFTTEHVLAGARDFLSSTSSHALLERIDEELGGSA
jgi:hypothetical protein